MSELDAVNEMLGSIGQAGVSSLDASTFGDAAIARGFLRTVTRYVQLYGFAFNTDRNYVLTPDTGKFLWLPDGVLRIDPEDKSLNIVGRKEPNSGKRAFWDRSNTTWAFDAPVSTRVTWAFEFEDLPESAKNYISVAASRRFQERMIGSAELDGFQSEDESRAWSLLVRDDRGNRHTNAFRQSKDLARQVARGGTNNPYEYRS